MDSKKMARAMTAGRRAKTATLLLLVVAVVVVKCSSNHIPAVSVAAATTAATASTQRRHHHHQRGGSDSGIGSLRRLQNNKNNNKNKDDGDDDDDDDDDDEDQTATTASPTFPPTFQPTASPTVAPTATPTAAPTEQLPVGMIGLLPFSLKVSSIVDDDEEEMIRQSLTTYMLQEMNQNLQRQNQVTGSNTQLNSIQLELAEAGGGGGGGRRRLQQQELMYQAVATLLLQSMDGGPSGVDADPPADPADAAAVGLDFATSSQVQSAQISVLEDATELQGYFLEEYKQAGGSAAGVDPVVVEEIQIDAREPVTFDTQATASAIATIDDDITNGNTNGGDSGDNNSPGEGGEPQQPTEGDSSNNDNNSGDNASNGVMIGIIVGVILIICGLVGAIVYYGRRRRDNNTKNNASSKIEVINEVEPDHEGGETGQTGDDDEKKRSSFFTWGEYVANKKKSMYSGESLDNILDEFEGTEIIQSPKGQAEAPVIDLTKPSNNGIVHSIANGWAGWMQQREAEGPLRKNGKAQKSPSTNQEYTEETADGASNLYNITVCASASNDDEDSMAGFSLASADTKRKQKAAALEKAKSKQNSSYIDPENPLLVGVQNLISSSQRLLYGEEPSMNDSRGASNGSVEVVPAPSLPRVVGTNDYDQDSTVYTGGDDDASLLTKDDESIYTRDEESLRGIESVAGYSASELSDADHAAGYDKSRLSSVPTIKSAPSEESDGMLNHHFTQKSKPLAPTVLPSILDKGFDDVDDHSDAPSDELGFDSTDRKELETSANTSATSPNTSYDSDKATMLESLDVSGVDENPEDFVDSVLNERRGHKIAIVENCNSPPASVTSSVKERRRQNQAKAANKAIDDDPAFVDDLMKERKSQKLAKNSVRKKRSFGRAPKLNAYTALP